MRHLILPKQGTHSKSIPENLLVMECVRCTIWTIILNYHYHHNNIISEEEGRGREGFYAFNRIPTLTDICVNFGGSFCHLDLVFWDYHADGVFAAAEGFAG